MNFNNNRSLQQNNNFIKNIKINKTLLLASYEILFVALKQIHIQLATFIK